MMSNRPTVDQLAKFRAEFLEPGYFGCSDEEIAQVEAAAGFPLPEEYKIYLRCCGGGHLYNMEDWEVAWEEAIKINVKDREVFTSVDFPERSFIFASRYGDAVRYFTDEGDDPPIYGFNDNLPRKLCDSIWEFF